MVLASMVITWFFTMTLVLRENVTTNLNKAYQALLMSLWMGLVMAVMPLLSGHSLSPFLKGVIAVCVFGILVVSYAIREQRWINPNQFMLSMIEHHQMAIEMVKRAQSQRQDSRLQSIASNILSSQSQEIQEMQALLRSNGITNQGSIFNLFR